MPQTPEKPDEPRPPIGDPPTEEKPIKVDDPPPAGEGEAANDPGRKQGEKRDDEETMPIEEGFSIVP